MGAGLGYGWKELSNRIRSQITWKKKSQKQPTFFYVYIQNFSGYSAFFLRDPPKNTKGVIKEF